MAKKELLCFAAEEEMCAAAKASNAHQFICTPPEGYDMTPLLEKVT